MVHTPNSLSILYTTVCDQTGGYELKNWFLKMGSGKWWQWWRWCPTSEEILERAERKVLEGLSTDYKSYFVTISKGYKIRTFESLLDHESERLPLVMIHGFGAGVAMWVLNIDELAKKQKVYAIDVLGFGRSSRPQFPSGDDAEELFIQSFEEWRREIGLEKFILLGHSFGAYLSASYTIRYPDNVRHLILADPWGLPEKNDETEKSFQLPWWARGVLSAALLFNPLDALRLVGPLGPFVLRKVRSDIPKKFDKLFNDDDTRVVDYLYHVLVQEPSGEAAFKSLTIPYGWARNPMLNRLVDHLDSSIPISVFYGSRSWMHIKSGFELKISRPNSYVHFHIIPDGSHHCYADEYDRFNTLVKNICEKVHHFMDTADELQRSGDQLTYDLESSDKFSSFLRPI